MGNNTSSSLTSQLKEEFNKIVNNSYEQSIDSCLESVQTTQSMNLSCNATDEIKQKLQDYYNQCISDSISFGYPQDVIDTVCPIEKKFACVFKNISQSSSISLNSGCTVSSGMTTKFIDSISNEINEKLKNNLIFKKARAIVESETDIKLSDIIKEIQIKIATVETMNKLLSAFNAGQVIDIGGVSIIAKNITQIMTLDIINDVSNDSPLLTRVVKVIDDYKKINTGPSDPEQINTGIVYIIGASILLIILLILITQ
jgi:hypothetical protein